MTDQRKGVTIAELVHVIRDRGVPIDRSTITYHCRHGWLQGMATKQGRDWYIETEAADKFAATYVTKNTARKPVGV